MNELQIFRNEEFGEVRTVVVNDEPMSGVYGAISGGVMGSGASVLNRISNRPTNRIPTLRDLQSAAANNIVDNNQSKDYNDGVNNNSQSFVGGNIDERSGEENRRILENGQNSGWSSSSNATGRKDTGADSIVHREFLVIDSDNRARLTNSDITDNEFRDTTSNPELFSYALDSSRKSNKYGMMVDPHSAEDIVDGNLITFLSKDNNAGGAVEPNGNITGVFKNPNSKSKNASTDIILTAIANGGNKLDCYGKGLVNMYSRLGFVPVARVSFNREYANPEWNYELFGEPDIYVMMHNGQ